MKWLDVDPADRSYIRTLIRALKEQLHSDHQPILDGLDAAIEVLACAETPRAVFEKPIDLPTPSAIEDNETDWAHDWQVRLSQGTEAPDSPDSFQAEAQDWIDAFNWRLSGD